MSWRSAGRVITSERGESGGRQMEVGADDSRGGSDPRAVLHELPRPIRCREARPRCPDRNKVVVESTEGFEQLLYVLLGVGRWSRTPEAIPPIEVGAEEVVSGGANRFRERRSIPRYV